MWSIPRHKAKKSILEAFMACLNASRPNQVDLRIISGYEIMWRGRIICRFRASSLAISGAFNHQRIHLHSYSRYDLTKGSYKADWGSTFPSSRAFCVVVSSQEVCVTNSPSKRNIISLPRQFSTLKSSFRGRELTSLSFPRVPLLSFASL